MKLNIFAALAAFFAFLPTASAQVGQFKSARVTGVVPAGFAQGSRANSQLHVLLDHYDCNTPLTQAQVTFGYLSNPVEGPGPFQFYSASFNATCRYDPTIDDFAPISPSDMLSFNALTSDWCDDSNCNFIYSLPNNVVFMDRL